MWYNDVIDKLNYSTFCSTLDAGKTGCCKHYASISHIDLTQIHQPVFQQITQLIPIKPPRNYWTVYVYIAIPIKPLEVWLVYWQIVACLTSINISFYGLLQPNIDFLLLPTLVCIEIQRKDAETRCKLTLTATGILPQILALSVEVFWGHWNLIWARHEMEIYL